jgi:hypothetical protein
MKKVKRMMFGGVSKALGNAAKKVAAKAPAPAPTPARSGFSSIRAGEGRAMANRNKPAPTPGVVPIPTNLPKMSGPLGTASSMPQLQAAANAMRGLPLGSKQTPTPPSMASQISGLGLKRPGIGMKKGGKVSSASSRGDGCAIRGKTRA